MTTYRIEAKTSLPLGEISYAKRTKNYVLVCKMADILCCAFETVKITNNETGEVYVNHYVSRNYKLPTLTSAEALAEVEKLWYDHN